MNCLFNKLVLLLCIFSISESTLYSQDTSKIELQKPAPTFKSYQYHSPHKAALLSAVLPGAGQIYNKKYWKVPIVWAGIGFFVYQWMNENSKYQHAKEVYLQLLDTNVTVKPTLNGTSNIEIVQSTKNIYRSQRDLYLIIGLVFYSFNIVDAAVDAHFFKFDVSDDLSMKFNLEMINYGQASAPSLNIKLYSDTKKKKDYLFR